MENCTYIYIYMKVCNYTIAIRIVYLSMAIHPTTIG